MKILVLEDEMLIGFAMADALRDAGHDVLGPFPSSARALGSIEEELPDAAILDVNLGGNETSEPVARTLAARSVPFVFTTGYSEVPAVRDRFPGVGFLSKPVMNDRLIAAIDDLTAT